MEPYYICASMVFDPMSTCLWTGQEASTTQVDINKLYSGVGIRSRNRFANFLLGNATPPAARWLVLEDGGLPTDEIDEDAEDYWAAATEVIRRDLSGATGRGGSFYNAKLREYGNMAVSYGVSYIYEGKEGGLQTGEPVYRDVPPQSFYFQRDEFDRLSACAFVRQMTNAEAQSIFQKDVVDAENEEERASRSTERKTIIQMVIRNPKGNSSPKGIDDFPYLEYWIDEREKEIVRRKGYYSQPFHVMDWYRVGHSSYGIGPAFDAMPDMIGANAARRAQIAAMELISQPPLLGAKKIEGALKTLRSGRVTWNAMTDTGLPKIQALQGVANPGALFQQVADDEQRVSNAMFEFDMNLPGTANMSATEVAERSQQRAAMVTPFAVNIMPSIQKQIARHYEIRARSGGLPELPQSIAEKGKFGMQMLGPLALAARQTDVVTMLQTIDQVSMIEQMPSRMIDKNEVAFRVADQAGHASILRNPAEVEAEAKQDAAMQQQMAAATVGQAEAQAAKTGVEALNGVVA